MIRRPALLATALLTAGGLTGCNLMEGLRQFNPGNNSSPVIFSDPWKTQRRMQKEEARRLKERQNLEAWAAYLARTQP